MLGSIEKIDLCRIFAIYLDKTFKQSFFVKGVRYLDRCSI